MTNLIDQAKTLMQGCGKEVSIDKFHSEVCGNYSILCKLCKAKASQMLIDLTNEKEFLNEKMLENGFELTCFVCRDYKLDLNNRLKKINSAIEILEDKK